MSFVYYEINVNLLKLIKNKFHTLCGAKNIYYTFRGSHKILFLQNSIDETLLAANCKYAILFYK